MLVDQKNYILQKILWLSVSSHLQSVSSPIFVHISMSKCCWKFIMTSFITPKRGTRIPVNFCFYWWLTNTSFHSLFSYHFIFSNSRDFFRKSPFTLMDLGRQFFFLPRLMNIDCSAFLKAQEALHGWWHLYPHWSNDMKQTNRERNNDSYAQWIYIPIQGLEIFVLWVKVARFY